MPTFSADRLRHIGRQIFEACGSPPEEAAVVTDILVDASLMGIASHGVIRFVWYIEEYLAGKIHPGAAITVGEESNSTAVLDGGGNFGAVAAQRAVRLAVEKARSHQVSCVTLKNCHHVACLGAFAEMAARDDKMICIATASWSKAGHYVAPWGGRQPRLATNPFAYAIPAGKNPLILDMSTSAISEGKIKVLRNCGENLPKNSALDASGAAVRDPNDFFGPPRGTILPFGGEHGFKGFGLAVLVELLSNTLSGNLVSRDDPYGQRACFIVIDPRSFMPMEQFESAVRELKSYLLSAEPAQGFDGVILPGEYRFRRKERLEKEGIPLDEETWSQIVETGQRVGVEISR